MAKGITCTCGHSWNKSDSSKKDMYVCHICGKDNTMKDGGWLDKFEDKLPTAQIGTNIAKTDATRVATPTLKLTQAQLEKNKAINKQVMANTNKAKAKEVAKRTEARNKPGKTISEVFTNKDQYDIQERFRLFPGDTEYGQVFDEYFNPAYFTADMASNLGNSLQTGDYKGAAMTAGLALGVGALGFDPLSSVARTSSPIIKKGLKSGIKAIDQNFTQVGKQLVNIEKEGIAKGLSPQEIKMQQMNEVGITSMQREGYVPGVSEVFSEYITPMSYDNPVKRVLDIPRRIISGERNSKNLSDINADFIFDFADKNLLGKPRYDAWRMYTGLPQKNNTFRIAETSPVNHPSYSTEQLSKLEKFSLNNEQKLLGDLPSEYDGDLSYLENSELVEALPSLKNKLKEIQELKTKGIDVSNDFTRTNVMGGYNRRFFDNKMEYNDIWDLVLGKTNVDKYFGKPFLSHGQLDYSFTPAEEGLNRVIEKAEYYKGLGENIAKPKTSFIDATYLKNPKPLNIKDLKANKYKQGGWLDKYNDGGPVQPNYNDASVSYPPNFVGDGYDTTGRNYSPAWGGQFQNGGTVNVPTIKDEGSFNKDGAWVPNWKAMAAQAKKLGAKKVKTDQGSIIYFNDKWEAVSADDSKMMAMGGSLPGATGHFYARYSSGGSAPGDADYNAPRTGQIPNNGKYAKKTKASAQNGTEMRYYQEGLDWKPKSISRDGSVIKDDMGQYNHPGEITEIGSNQITMQGVPYPVLGISDTGDTQMMYPNEDYTYEGSSVTEYPMMAQGGQLTKLDQLTNFTNYNTKQPGGWLDKY